VLPSEKGLFELAGRQAGLPLREVAMHFRDLISADWADSRKARFRRSASRVNLASLVLAALATVVLGIEAIPGRSWVALPPVATVTVLGALEPFFNWRSRWVLMEEAQYRLKLPARRDRLLPNRHAARSGRAGDTRPLLRRSAADLERCQPPLDRVPFAGDVPAGPSSTLDRQSSDTANAGRPRAYTDRVSHAVQSMTSTFSAANQCS
jgi:hypothetical protein